MMRRLFLSMFLILALAIPTVTLIHATVSSETNRNDYTGNGSTATYAYGFKIFAKTDLKITRRYLTNAEDPLTVDVDYTVSGVGNTNGGSITLTQGNLPSGYTITIRRLRPLTQQTDIRNQGDFFPEIHENALDDLVMKDQTLKYDLDRSLKLPESSSGISTILPFPVANKWLRWNSTATAIENVDPGSTGEPDYTVRSINGIVFADQFPGANVTERIDAALASASTVIVIIPTTMASGNATTIPTGKLILDLRSGNLAIFSGTEPAITFRAPVGSANNLIEFKDKNNDFLGANAYPSKVDAEYGAFSGLVNPARMDYDHFVTRVFLGSTPDTTLFKLMGWSSSVSGTGAFDSHANRDMVIDVHTGSTLNSTAALFTADSGGSQVDMGTPLLGFVDSRVRIMNGGSQQKQQHIEWGYGDNWVSGFPTKGMFFRIEETTTATNLKFVTKDASGETVTDLGFVMPTNGLYVRNYIRVVSASEIVATTMTDSSESNNKTETIQTTHIDVTTPMVVGLRVTNTETEDKGIRINYMKTFNHR